MRTRQLRRVQWRLPGRMLQGVAGCNPLPCAPNRLPGANFHDSLSRPALTCSSSSIFNMNIVPPDPRSERVQS